MQDQETLFARFRRQVDHAFSRWADRIADAPRRIIDTGRENGLHDAAFSTTPDDRVLIARKLPLFENSGSDDLEKLDARQFQIARVSTRKSIRHTLETTGQALLTTSLVLATGFSVFLFATMPTLQTFGFITTLAILLAFIADILVAPALVTLSTRNRKRPTPDPNQRRDLHFRQSPGEAPDKMPAR
jgi:hypothetical protein